MQGLNNKKGATIVINNIFNRKFIAEKLSQNTILRRVCLGQHSLCASALIFSKYLGAFVLVFNTPQGRIFQGCSTNNRSNDIA